jgi:NAD(P)-dependent dehydrogenase (short-subunit alcohol dehydrogenase family)
MTQTTPLAGAVARVTGASRGIGKGVAIARQCDHHQAASTCSSTTPSPT